MSFGSGRTATVSESDAQASPLFIPLLFISVLFVGALPFYVRQPVVGGESVSGPAWFGGARLGEPAADVYWLCALPVCIGAVAVYCVWSERRSGVAMHVRLWLVASVGLSSATAVFVQNGMMFYVGNMTIRGLLPLLAISIAVLVWGVGLRSRLLVAIGVVAVAASLVSNLYNVENLVPREWALDPRFGLWPNIVLTAAVFAVGAVGSGFAERSRR